ncbi:MAG TPA: hypothetical protein VHA78_05590 [Candidatus Peribacteraceae bacterium]|nr:hypothetical protein [Candidatus Peribacteraceae bacterium]
MMFIPHRFNGFPHVTLREKREIFDMPSPETQPSMPPTPETQEQINDPDEAMKTANDKMQNADQAFQARAQLLDQAEADIRNLKTVAEDPNAPDPMNLEAAFGATENTLGQLDAETQSAVIPPEVQGLNMRQLIDQVRNVNPDAAGKAESYVVALGETRESLKTNPDAAQRFGQIENHALLLLQKHLALQLSPQQGNERSQKAIEKNVDKAKEIASKIDLTNMTQKQMNRQIAMLMMNYGVDVVQNGNRLEVIAPMDSFSSLWNRVQGIIMLITGFSEKETGKKAYEGPPNGGKPPEDGKPPEGGDTPPAETELGKELNDKTISVVRIETQTNLDKATKELDGDTAAGTIGLREEKKNLEHDQLDKKDEVTRLENDVKNETDPAAKEAKQKDLNTAQGELNALAEKIKTVDSNIKLTEETQTKMKTKLEEIKKLEEAADKEKDEMNTQLTKMHDDLGKAPLDANPDAQIIRTMISGVTAERVTDKLQMKLIGVDADAWSKGIDVAIKNGIDRKAFDTNADGSLASAPQLRSALTKIMETLSAGADALDKGVKEFMDKGAREEDAKEAAKLNADHPNLKLDYKNGQFVIPESSDIEAGQILARKYGELGLTMKKVLQEHINTAMSDITSARGEKMFRSYMTETNPNTSEWSDAQLQTQMIQLAKQGVSVKVTVQLDSAKADEFVAIDKAKAKDTDLYKSGALKSALKRHIDA